MTRYAELAVAALEQHLAKPLAFYGALIVRGGRALEGAVVLQFPSAKTAQARYHSKAYQTALPNRMAGTDYEVFIVDGESAAKVSG